MRAVSYLPAELRVYAFAMVLVYPFFGELCTDVQRIKWISF
jgi:hypothetical protein